MKILIVEDEVLISEHLRDLIYSFGNYIIELSHNFDNAVENYNLFKPDIVLIDINLNDKMNGIKLAELIKKDSIPFIFITANSDIKTLEEALSTKPSGYIIKPFKNIDIYTSLRIIEEKLISQTYDNDTQLNFIVKHGNSDINVKKENLLYLRANGNYTELITINRKFSIRLSIKNLISEINYSKIQQTHRSFAVNINKIISVKGDRIILLDNSIIPLSRNYKNSLINKLPNRIY